MPPHITTFSISKDVNSISLGFKDMSLLLNAVKIDYRMIVTVNKTKFPEYFLNIKKNYPEYLHKILLSANQNAHFLLL